MSRILLVDDDIAEISAVKRVLLRGGHQPVLATNASDASASIARDPPELLLVSSTCESGGALALARNLPAGRGGANLPLLVLGEAGGLPDGARHLPRPLDPEQLAAEVKAALGPAGALSVSDPAPPPPPRSTPPPTPTPAGERVIPAGRITLPLGMVAESLLPPPRSGRTASDGQRSPQPWAPPQAAPAGTDGLSQAMASRRAAAEALRARAEQLRRSAGTPIPLPPPAAAGAPAAAPAGDEGLEGDEGLGPILLDDPTADEPAPELPASALELEELGPPDPGSLFQPPPDLQPSIDDAELDAAFREAVIPATPLAGQLDSEAAPELAPVEAAEPTALEAREQATDEALRALEVEATTHAAERARARATAGPAGLEGFAEAAGAERRELEEAVEVARREGFEAARRELEQQARREAAEAARQAEVAARARLEEAQAAHRQAQDAARKEGFEAARRELGERARQELARRAQAEARARQEAVAAAQRETGELVQRRDEEARRRGEAEEKARAEAQARRVVEEQLQTLRDQLDLERKKAEERVATVMQRAAEEEEAAEELRRMAEDEIQRRDEAQARTRADEEEKLRSAIAAARAELEALRRQGEEETRRRAEAEAALARMEETRREERRREEARLEEGRREEARRAAPPPAPPAFAPPSFLGPFEEAEDRDRPVPAAQPAPAAEPVPPVDPAEEAARKRVAALRAPSEPRPAAPAPRSAQGERMAPQAAPATPLPPEPGPAPAPAPDLEEPPRSLAPPAAALRAGELAELPAPRLLALAARTQLEGRLDFQGAVTRSLWFEGGRVVGAGSADPSERLEEVALRVGLITRDQHRQIAQASSALPSRRAALLLLERGFIKPGELTGLARRRTEEVVFGIFGEPGGPFRWVGAEVPPEERTALERGTLALAVEGVRRRWLAPQLDALLGGPATLLAPSAEPLRPAELGLSAEERRALALADGLRTLDEIVEASSLDPLTTRQLLAALVAVGGLSVRILQHGRPAGRAAVEIDLARVKDKLDQVRRADYFTVLGVGRLCTPHEVREAANRLLAEFDPLRLAGVADEGLPARLLEIGQVVRDAREVLANDRLRGEYLRGLGDAG